MDILTNIHNLIQQQQYNTALCLCQDNLATAGHNNYKAKLFDLLAWIYCKMNQPKLAIKNLLTAIDLDPFQANFHCHLAQCYQQDYQLNKASQHLHEALRLEPNHGSYWYHLGCLSQRQNKLHDAIFAYQKSLRLDKSLMEAHYNLASCYIKQNAFELAIAHLLIVVDAWPTHNDSLTHLAMCYLQASNYNQAKKYLLLAVKNQAINAEIIANLAYVLWQSGDLDHALAYYYQAITLSTTTQPHHATWHHNIAVILTGKTHYHQAYYHFQQSLNINQDNPTADYMLQAIARNNIAKPPNIFIQELFAQYAPYYDKHMQDNLEYKLPGIIRQTLGKHISFHTQLNSVDLGCGTGLLGIYLRDISRSLLGIDLSLHMLAKAKKLNAYDQLYCGDIDNIIPGENSQAVDLFVAAEVFNYLGDLSKLCARIYQALACNGYLCFSIETNEYQQPYCIQPTGRYSHNPRILYTYLTTLGFSLIHQQSLTLRQHHGQPVNGVLVLLQKLR